MTKRTAAFLKYSEYYTYLWIPVVYLQIYHECLDNGDVVPSTAVLCMIVYWQIMAYIPNLLSGNTIPAAVKDHSRSIIQTQQYVY